MIPPLCRGSRAIPASQAPTTARQLLVVPAAHPDARCLHGKYHAAPPIPIPGQSEFRCRSHRDCRNAVAVIAAVAAAHPATRRTSPAASA